MQISQNWLTELTSLSLDTEIIAQQLTMAGLEVDSITPVAHDLERVVIVQILSRESHPNSDKYAIYEVQINTTETIQIVSLCKDIAENTKLACVLVGGKVGDMQFTTRDFAGITSYGMFCSGDTLGLQRNNSKQLLTFAADAPVGQAVSVYLSLTDNIIDIDLTPNRGDCLSMYGIARELSAMNNMLWQGNKIKEIDADLSATYPLAKINHHACIHYANQIITDINMLASTPIWMQERLERSGISTNNIVVDIANYVMIELGQPLHTFDKAKLSGGLIIDFATAQETATLLDGKQINLDADTLVVRDEQKIVALAGIIGCNNSSVSSTTQEIVLESAAFTQDAILGRARKYGLNTDAAYRFERGVDTHLQTVALHRAAELLKKYASARVSIIKEYGHLKQLHSIQLHLKTLQTALGVKLKQDKIIQILHTLDCTVDVISPNLFSVTVPSFRFDLTIEADLVEEVARIFGYDNLPENTPTISPQHIQEFNPIDNKIAHRLLNLGYTESISYSFIDSKTNQLFTDTALLELANPISTELASMRYSLWGSLLKTLAYNYKRNNLGLKLFETGRIYALENGQVIETAVLSGVVGTDSRLISSWSVNIASSFYTVKGELESSLANVLDTQQLVYKKSSVKGLHPGETAKVYYKNSHIATLGKIHPQLVKHFGISEQPWVFTIFLDTLPQTPLQASIAQVNIYPSIARDLSLLVDNTITYAELLEHIQHVSSNLLQDIQLFDVYANNEIADNKTSLSIKLIWCDTQRTLTDKEVNIEIEAILSSLKQTFGIDLR